MSEAIERFKMIATGFDARVQAAPPGSWSNQSPCSEWKASDVVKHVANNYRRLAGESLPPIDDDEVDIVVAWNASRDALFDTLTNGDLSAPRDTPFGPMPLEQFVGRIIATDTLVHTWDLARAVGGDERLDAAAVSGSYSGLKPLDAMIRRAGLFDAKIEPPAGADEQTEFLCFLGRRV